MYRGEKEYGKVIMSSYLPTHRAERFLNYFQTAGWHECNPLYRHSYESGISGYLLIFTVSGKGILQLNGITYTLTAGAVAIVPPDLPVSYFTNPKSEWEFYWINVHGVYAAQILSCILEEHEPVFITGNMINYIEKVKQLIQWQDENKFRFELEVSQRITELLHEMIKGIYLISQETDFSENVPIKITAYLEQHYAEPIQLARLSRDFHFSKNQLIRVFQAETGYTPYEYLKRYRLLKACELLRLTNHTIAEIGEATGFSSSSNFIVQFKAQYMVTPYQYRKHFSSSL